MKTPLRNLLILIAILIFGLLLRTLFLNSSPPSLYGDELTITLDAYSLLKTGQDQLGNFLPLTFPMGAGRPAGYVYGSIPFVAIFGPTALGVRSLSILSGIGILLLLYLLGKQLFSEKIGLLAAAIAAVSPWDISLSRGGFEAHFALFLALMGTYLLVRAKENSKFFILSALSFGLTLHTYPTYKVSLLLFLPLLFWFQKTKDIFNTGRKNFFAGLVVLLVLGFLSLTQTFTSGSEARFADINILSQENLKNSIEQKINFERQITALSKSISRYFHNKPVEYTKVFIENYLQNFSMDFLVLHGDRNPRHNMATMGEIYVVDLILICIGILNFWQRQKKTLVFLLLWTLVAPIPSAIVDLPHALRSSFMLPPLLILSALGLVTLINSKKRVALLIISLIFIFQFAFFLQKLYFLAPAEYANFWSYPAKLASEIAITNKDKYDFIILSDAIDNIEFAYPVYTKINPIELIAQNMNKSTLGEYKFKKFDNIYIGNIPNGDLEKFLDSLSSKVLYVGNLNDLSYLRNYETINNMDGSKTLVMTKRGI